ncbi:MAG: hypothetical protein KDA75_00160 [Planctomycetaceae bacterium]|nr:hypothetical protein [Planctomycetaceae bacterium]
MTGCVCSGPGFCERHGCQKSRHWWRRCRTSSNAFQEWELGCGLGQGEDSAVPASRLIAPLRNVPVRDRPWEGACRRKPWDYRVTAAIPVLDTPEPLELVIDLLRLQTERPFIVVIDTGSQPDELAKIAACRAADVEVHSLRLNGVRHPSDFPAMAMDLAFAICRTRYLFATHADCFLRSRTLLNEMVDLCPRVSPVVGYELTPRQHPDWKGMVGHTCTLFDMPTMDDIGAGWSMRRLVRMFDIETHEPNPNRPNWPDTELLVNYIVRQAGYRPHLIGHEENFVRNRDDNIDHCRTLTGGLLYNQAHYEKAKVWADEAMQEARERIAVWRTT